MIIMLLSSNWIQNFWWKVICIGISIGNTATISGGLANVINETTTSMSKLRKYQVILLWIGGGCGAPILMS